MTQDSPTASKIKSRRKAPKRITQDHLHNAGLAYLQRFPTSSAHFRAVMKRRIDRSCRAHTDQDRAACAELLEAVIAKFTGMGLLDDSAYLRGMVSSYRRRGLSARLIEAKLQQKGYGSGDIRQALSIYEEGDQNSELAAALRLARKKKIGPFGAGGNDPKALAALARAGFSYETSQAALNCPGDEADRLLSTG